MVKKLNPSFVEYFAAYLKKILSKPDGTITAKDFQEHVTTAANVYLNENYGADPSAVRSAIAQSTPENECTKAINARIKYEIGTDNRITFYKNQAQINSETKAETLESAKKDHPEVKVWTSKTNMLLFDKTANKKRQLQVELEPYSAVYCGECWICKTDVMSYTGISTKSHFKGPDTLPELEYGTTPCGDCEHVSAIMASYIAGMLTSAGFAKVYWASYYVACVECNRRKSNYIGVKLDATNGWQVDNNGVNAIVDAIFPINGVEPHASEYNPIRNALSDKYNRMTPGEKTLFREEVSGYIVDGTRTWCEAANTNMNKATATTKHIKMSFNVSKIIVAITGHLNVITGPLEKRAKKAVKAGRTPVKPKLNKPYPTNKRPRVGGGNESQGGTDSVDSSDNSQKESKNDDNSFNTVVNPLNLQWYNLIGEAEVDAEYDDEDDEEDDNETDDEFEARIIKYKDVIVEYIGNTYSRLLFKQYESDPTIFGELMVNLSNSMYDILNDSTGNLLELDDGTLDMLYNRTVPSSPAGRTRLFVPVTDDGQIVATSSGKDESKDVLQDISKDILDSDSDSIGGSKLNKRHSKNKTKRISYIKHKQTRKNQYSRKTNKN